MSITLPVEAGKFLADDGIEAGQLLFDLAIEPVRVARCADGLGAKQRNRFLHLPDAPDMELSGAHAGDDVVIQDEGAEIGRGQQDARLPAGRAIGFRRAKEALDLHAQAIGFPGFAEQVQSIGEDAAEQGRFAKLFKVRRVK